MTVSVLIVTWNNARSIERCLDAVRGAAEGIPTQILVWDNASSDGTAERVAADLVVDSAENVGFAGGMNALAAWATGRWLLLLNPDAYLEPDALPRLLEAASKRTIVGACLAGLDGRVQPACGRPFPSPWSLLRPVLLRRPAAWDPGARRREVDAVSGACMLVPAAMWRELGGLDEDYPHSGEDLDLCLRARRAGARVVYQPAARATHEHEASVRQAPPEIDVLRWAGAVRFVGVHRGPLAALVVRTALASHAAAVVGAGALGYTRSARSLRRARLVGRWALTGARPALPSGPEAAL